MPAPLATQASFLKDTIVKRDKTEMRNLSGFTLALSAVSMLTNYLSSGGTVHAAESLVVAI